jgi:hypothetical protein
VAIEHRWKNKPGVVCFQTGWHEEYMMHTRLSNKKAAALILTILALAIVTPVSSFSVPGMSPIGRVATSGRVFINGTLAPIGTVLCSDDRVAVSGSSARITLKGGNSVLLTESAAALFSRSGNTLVIQVDKGIIEFSFAAGEAVSIKAGTYQFDTSTKAMLNAGKLTLSGDGRPVMTLSTGWFSALNAADGTRSEVLPAFPQALGGPEAGKQSGNGSGESHASSGGSKGMIIGGVSAVGGVGLALGVWEATKSAK